MTKTQQIHAQNFRALHALNVSPLVLPNAWDAASAGIIIKCGAKAIATTSAGVSWSHGFSDGEQLSRAAHLSTIREIVRAAAVPVTVDVEGGYSDDPHDVANLISEIIESARRSSRECGPGVISNGNRRSTESCEGDS